MNNDQPMFDLCAYLLELYTQDDIKNYQTYLHFLKDKTYYLPKLTSEDIILSKDVLQYGQSIPLIYSISGFSRCFCQRENKTIIFETIFH